MTDNIKGFTLIELLIVVLITSIVITGLWSTFRSQHVSAISQEQVAAMQQNIRAAMMMMGREIRMAGYDPSTNALTGITAADHDTITFSMDSNGDGSIAADEIYTYLLYTDSGRQNLGRINQTGPYTVAENIDALNFVYLDASNMPLNAGISAVPPSDLPLIRSVEISIVARGDETAPDYYRDKNTYSNMRGTQIFTGGGTKYRRRLLTSHLKCRNLAF